MSRPTQVAPRTISAFRLRDYHPLRSAFPRGPAMRKSCFVGAPITPEARRHASGLGYSPFARHYSGNRVYFLFLRVLRCFSSPRSPPASPDDAVTRTGLPHSDIRGSPGICPSPRLFAAYHVLLRLREPRHPPCALSSLRYS